MKIEEISDKVLGLIKKDRNKAIEIIVKTALSVYDIYSTRDDLKSEMWIYKDGIYIPDGRSYIKELCRTILKRSYTPQITNLVINRVEVDSYIDPREFFSIRNVEEIPVQNGILNVINKKLSKFTPKKIFFEKLPVTYDRKAKCPRIHQFFKDVLRDPEDRLLMFELAGFGLLKEYRYERAFMFNGDGRNGKGKTMLLLKSFVGSENTASIPIHALKHDSFSLSELFGKLFNLGGDLASKDFKETEIFKGLTGRDQLNARRKFLKDIRLINYAKMVFACNELPRVYDFTPGFWIRWILLDFPYKFVTKLEYDKASEKEKEYLKVMDPQIIDKITTKEELSGLLNEALIGLQRLIKQRDFSYTKGSKEVKEMWIRKSDSFTAFCLDCLEEDQDNIIPKAYLRKAFYLYRKKHKLVKGTSDQSIKVSLQEMFGTSEQKIQLKDDREYCWIGIKFKEGVQDVYGILPYIKKLSFAYSKKNYGHPSQLDNSTLCFRCSEPIIPDEAKQYMIGDNPYHKECFTQMKGGIDDSDNSNIHNINSEETDSGKPKRSTRQVRKEV